MLENKKNIDFWKTGNGKDFLTWANISEEEMTSDFDTNLFLQYDQKVDEMVANWMKNGDFKNVMASLHLQSKDEDLPKDFIAFKNSLKIIPDWLDEELIAAGCQLSERSGLNGLLILRNFALLGGYNFANLTKPLVATGSLEKGAVHRLYNTLNFWVEVSRMSENAQEMRVNACIRTRLIHSASRLMINKSNSNWNVERYGIPINHADMIATNIAFTVYFLYGLNQLNFKYSKKEELGIFHLWKYVTYLLGVPSEIIPNNKFEALDFFHFWTKYQGQPDEDALKLAEALLNENTPISLLKSAIVKRNMSYIHRSISNELIDSTIKENLKIPKVRFQSIIINALRLKNTFNNNHDKQRKEGHIQQKSVLQDYKNNSV